MGQWAACFARTVTCVVTLLAAMARPQQRKQTSSFAGKPFVTVWNAPTHDCARYSVSLNLEMFDIVSSPNEGFYDQQLTIFYKERLGRYPYFQGQSPVNGGVPQNSSLLPHLDAVRSDIRRYMRSWDKEGLAVIDWEEWRPLWIRNWKNKQIYRDSSLSLVSQRHPDWSQADVSRQAQFEFEQSAQRFMVQTLQEGRNTRPRSLWGFYLFPDCYNHDYKNNAANYTGRCPDVEIARNDLLTWLWRNSTAIYPSIYLDRSLRSSPSAHKFVRSRVKEALRVSQLHGPHHALPVFVYSRPTYSYTVQLLTERDLVTTIGETAALGAAGIIFWGDTDYSNSAERCRMMKSYVGGVFGRYLLNVTTATRYCSQFLCGGRGRCERRDSEAETYLHLSPDSFRIQESPSEGAGLQVSGALTQRDRQRFQEDFQCRCFRGWLGQQCGIAESAGLRSLPSTLAPLLALLLPLIL
ncbi:hyaluronidase-2-like [Pristis pectinata]|uniref:hyaluronidase-2-like n=1 Tax=Pristis pectinata TaxID=685728 RepID=UPI00223CC583|nr:hyaluronidase-2-like [Pristis pectinata]XP_051874402.1 hyaluronidase-2-like [Pristis pectinata]